jgi:hypothetical protein
MQESLLHYIWQFQYFDKRDLKTSSGESVTVFHPGFRNTHAGPDFSQARIKIGDLEWIGNVEIHIHASGWKDHHHDQDAAYDNVVLHVVWKEDAAVSRKDKTSLPTLELAGRVDDNLLLRFNSIFLNPETIPCASSLSDVNPLIKLSMVEKALMSRLETKSKIVFKMLADSGNDWEEVCYQLLCKNFGFKVNADPFLMLAKNLPYKVIMKHGDKLLQIEALLFGQAGMLDERIDDDYFKLLKREHTLLSQKFGLESRKLNKAQWRFLRLRPANFPTIRLAQLAAILHVQKNIFSKFTDATSYKTLVNVLTAQQSAYWVNHYLFGKTIEEKIPGLGKSSIDNVIVNTVVPLMVAWSRSRDDQEGVDRAVQILHDVTGEENMITRKWTSFGLKPKNAFDSQALIELYNNFCLRRKCLDCSIGASLIRPSRA